MLYKIFWLCIGILFLPVCVGYSSAFYEHLIQVRKIGEPEIALLLGITAYLAYHVLIGAPTRAYVFGHELTHATATWISGGQVKGFKAGTKKGSILVDRLTAFIALAPYLIPVYAILWSLIFSAVGLFVDLKPWARWFFFGLGAALAFHLVFTVEALKQKQSDLEVVGPILSVGMIYWANVTLVLGVMSLMVMEVHFWAYLKDGAHHSVDLYRSIFTQLFVR